MNYRVKLIALSVLVAFLSACDSSDNEDQIITTSKGDILFVSMLPNPDGQTGSSYMQLIDNLDPASYDNKSAIPVPFGSAPILIDNDVYILPGWTEETDVFKKYTRIDGKLQLTAQLTLPENSGATHLVAKDNKIYVSFAKRGTIFIINKSTFKKDSEIDISSYGVGDNNPDPGCMIIRDDLLYVGLNQMVGGYYPALERPAADVLIIDTKTDKVVKMITENKTGISQATRPVDPQSIFMDEQKNIYVVCLGAFGAHPTHKAGILRIKAGETEFDDSYNMVVNNTAIEGESNKANVLWMVQYAGNNKLYATANIPAYHGDPVNYIEDRTVESVEIDLANKTIKNLGIPRSNSFGMSVGMYKNQIIFGLATTDSNGFYTYDLTSKKTSDNAIITVTGYPSGIRSFNDN
ncbi:hypothetical protein EYV94_20500 [Puteibacter caeruleilacunae]|nr:hypothetical protein EYV94_20500 [Puteibacter caeruleilacunae]